MDNLNDLKAIWVTAKTTDLPEAKDILKMAGLFRNEKLRKKAFVICAASLLVALEIAVAIIYKSNMITTRLGEACIIIAGSMLVITNVRSIGRFYKFNVYSNKEFLAFLERTRINQQLYYTRTQPVALMFCCAGLPLYLFETVYGHFIAGLIIFSLSAVFMAVTWFVIRPRLFTRQSMKLNDTINRIKRISNQL